MEIQDKQVFKAELLKEIEAYVKHFPVYFYGNIIINVLLIGLIVGCIALIVMDVMLTVEVGESLGASVYMLIAIPVIGKILSITSRGFFRNVNVLHDIRDGQYKFGIDDHELDNAVEFLEDLPIEKIEVERMKISLSFGKLIEVMEASRIIVCEGNVYSVSLKFKYQVEVAMGKF